MLLIDSRENSDLAKLIITKANRMNIQNEKKWLEVGDYVIGDVCFDSARDEKHISTYTGDYFEICIVGDEGEENSCYDIYLIDGGIIRYYDDTGECVPQSRDIREPTGEYETTPSLLADDEEWHEEFADFVNDSQEKLSELSENPQWFQSLSFACSIDMLILFSSL